MSDFYGQLTRILMCSVFLSVSIFTYVYVYRRLKSRERRAAVRGGGDMMPPGGGRVMRRRNVQAAEPHAAEAEGGMRR